jgi:hypothetical protein
MRRALGNYRGALAPARSYFTSLQFLDVLNFVEITLIVAQNLADWKCYCGYFVLSPLQTAKGGNVSVTPRNILEHEELL